MAVSKQFLKAIRIAGLPLYEIAHKAGIHPVALYKISCGHDKPVPGDRRIIAIGRVLGLKEDELFE
jgi:hypothetical protein